MSALRSLSLGLLAALIVSVPASALDLGSVITRGSRDPIRTIESGIRWGIHQQQRAEAARQRQIAAENHSRRVAELKRTKAGRAQLRREANAERQRRQAQADTARAVIPLLFGGGGGGSAGSGDPCLDRPAAGRPGAGVHGR